APLSEAHIGLVALAEMPHGLRRSGSVNAAIPGMFDSRFVCLNEFLSDPAWAPMAGRATATAEATVSPTVNSLGACMRGPPCESPFSGGNSLFRLLRKGLRLVSLKWAISPTSCLLLSLF